MAFKVKDSKFIPTDSNQVLSLFKNLNKSEGAGPDGISSQLIIDCADLIAPHIISVTFNSSLAIMVYFLRIGSPVQRLLLYS